MERKISKQLVCSMCLDEYHRPRVLPCLHVFCEDCLKKLVERQPDKHMAPCPNCRKSVPLPEGGVVGLPAAFYIQHLFEVREVLEKVSNPKKARCGKCGEGEVEGFCRDCGQFVCQLCLDVHAKWKEFQSHEIIGLEQVQEKALMMSTQKKVIVHCSSHKTEPIKIYCETCEELMCYSCAIKTHRDHSYDLIPDAYPKHRDIIIACLGPIKSELTSVGKTISGLMERSTRLDGQGVEAKAKVDAEVGKLKAILEARRRELHSEIDGVVNQGKKELAAEIDQHELRQTQLSSCVEFVEGSLQSGTQEEVLSIKKQVEQKTREMAEEFKQQKQLELEPEKSINVSFSRELNSVVKTLGSISLGVKFKGVHLATIPDINHPCHAAFASSGEMVVCEWHTNRMRVYDTNHQLLRTFGNRGPRRQGKLEEPLGVAVSPDNTVYVSSCHCVKKFTLDGDFLASVGSEGSGPLQFHTPFALAYNKTNDRIYVCDTVNNRVTILDQDLSFCDSFGSKGRELGQFNTPEGIAIDGKGNVLVADHLNNRVQIFNPSGRFLSCISQTEPGQRLQGPISVAVGPDDAIYIVENYSNCVSSFDENRKYVSSFGGKGKNRGEFDDPYAVAVSPRGHVCVSDTNNNRIQFFH